MANELEYEKTIAQLQIDLTSKSKTLTSLESDYETLDSSFIKERETSKILDAELTKSKQDLSERAAEVEFLQAQVLEFDAKINVAGKSCISQLEAQGSYNTTLKQQSRR
jgi:chromosome segregation ATPase